MTDTTRRHILVLGAGSVGRRHGRNLAALGARVSYFDPRADRLEQARSEVADAGTFDGLETALRERLDGVVIASPPNVHVSQAMACLQRGLPVLLEKPVAPTLAEALQLAEAATGSERSVLLGYTYRWWPPLLHMRERLLSGAIGPVRHARFTMSAHLADWHPWERYQDFFMASKELGGGALLDESHFIDLMLWFFGMPESLYGHVEHLSTLEISTDDNVDVIVRYPGGLRATIHLDLYGRPHQKSILVAGENGTIECLFDPDTVKESVTGATPVVTTFTCERNDMFLDEAREFLAMIAGTDRVSCTLADGIQVLRCVEAVRTSTEQGRVVAVAG